MGNRAGTLEAVGIENADGKGGNAVVISVIILTYNREGMVDRAIESISRQTFRDFELIVVDNGSEDDSGKIADRFAREDNRIQVIHKEKGNIGSGRNAGLDAACGDYIAFVDDDDWVEPDFLEFLFGLITETGADIAVCGTSVKPCEEKLVMTAEEAVLELMRRKKYNTGFPTKMFSSKLFQKERFSDSEKTDDIGLIYKLMAGAGKVAYHGLPKYHVYRHPGNNSAWTTDHKLLTAEILEEYLQIYHVRTQWLSGRFPDRTGEFCYFEWSFMISMVEKVCRLKLTDCREPLKRMRDELRKHGREFLGRPEIMEFEREWMEKYIVYEEMTE